MTPRLSGGQRTQSTRKLWLLSDSDHRGRRALASLTCRTARVRVMSLSGWHCPSRHWHCDRGLPAWQFGRRPGPARTGQPRLRLIRLARPAPGWRGQTRINDSDGHNLNPAQYTRFQYSRFQQMSIVVPFFYSTGNISNRLREKYFVSRQNPSVPDQNLVICI